MPSSQIQLPTPAYHSALPATLGGPPYVYEPFVSSILVREQIPSLQRPHSHTNSGVVPALVGITAAIGGAVAFSASQEALNRSELGLSRLDNLERSLHDSEQVDHAATPALMEIAHHERRIFNRVREASMAKKALAIAAIVGGVLMTLGVLLSATTIWGEVAIVLGTLCLLGTGIAAAIIAIRDGFRDATVDDARAIERGVDSLVNARPLAVDHHSGPMEEI